MLNYCQTLPYRNCTIWTPNSILRGSLFSLQLYWSVCHILMFLLIWMLPCCWFNLHFFYKWRWEFGRGDIYLSFLSTVLSFVNFSNEILIFFLNFKSFLYVWVSVTIFKIYDANIFYQFVLCIWFHVLLFFFLQRQNFFLNFYMSLYFSIIIKS